MPHKWQRTDVLCIAWPRPPNADWTTSPNDRYSPWLNNWNRRKRHNPTPTYDADPRFVRVWAQRVHFHWYHRLHYCHCSAYPNPNALTTFTVCRNQMKHVQKTNSRIYLFSTSFCDLGEECIHCVSNEDTLIGIGTNIFLCESIQNFRFQNALHIQTSQQQTSIPEWLKDICQGNHSHSNTMWGWYATLWIISVGIPPCLTMLLQSFRVQRIELINRSNRGN